MKLQIGSKVRFCTHSRAPREALIIGEVDDGREAPKWIVNCDNKDVIGAVFYKESEDNKHYNFGNRAFWIEGNE
jgi:hypothetical protein